jgi:hypothetical protein
MDVRGRTIQHRLLRAQPTLTHLDIYRLQQKTCLNNRSILLVYEYKTRIWPHKNNIIYCSYHCLYFSSWINLEQDVVTNPEVETNFGYVVSWLSGIWENHLSSPILYLWNDIFIDLFWEPFIEVIWSGDFINQLDGVGTIEE